MKRILCLFLSAVFLSVLCIPCAAADTGRAYPGFSDVAEDSAAYEAVKLCYERGLMNGKTEDSFDPQGKLTIAQLVVLAARLYHLQNGGDSTIPELPDLSQPYLRIYDKQDTLLFSWSPTENPPECNAFGGLPVINETVDVPDVSLGGTRDAEAILRLYQAGVLTGVDKAGNFNGGGELTRAQAAMMLSRVLEPSLRVKTA